MPQGVMYNPIWKREMEGRIHLYKHFFGNSILTFTSSELTAHSIRK